MTILGIRRGLFAGLIVVFAALAAPAAEPPKGMRVFTAGHSFHVFTAPLLVEMAKSANIAGHENLGTQFIGGSRTIQHWDLPDEKNEAKQALNTGNVDVLTLSPHILIPDQGIDNFVKLALEKNPNCRILVQASWMPFDDWENRTKDFKNESRNSAKIETLRKGYEKLDKEFHEQMASLNKLHQKEAVFIVPVGHAVMNLREKVIEGKAPGIANQADLFTDSIGHAKTPVAILCAYCHYAIIYKQSPMGLPVPNGLKKSEKGEELNKLLQEIAWEAVKKEPASGVK